MSNPETALTDDLTQDDFLGGTLSLFQPKTGYRAGVDPVFLAASVVAKPGESLLDLGCGVGTAALCVARRVPDVEIVGLERHAVYADLARRNGVLNGISFDVIAGDLAEMPSHVRQRSFNHVIANPPYFDRVKTTPSDETLKEHAFGEDTPLAEWVRQAAKRVAPGGTVTFIHRIDRLPDLLAHFQTRLGSLEVLPMSARQNKRPRMVLIRGQKGGRADFRLHSPWIVHEGHAHDEDRENYTPSTRAVLREAAPLPFS